MSGIANTIFYYQLTLSLFFLARCFYIQEGNDPKIIKRITFGSNYIGRIDKEENIFNIISKHYPDLWIWLGNAVNLNRPNLNIFSSSPSGEPNWDFVKKVYKKVKTNEYYSELSKKIPTIGTWGDYEYGLNFGNGENQMKESYKQHYLDFLDATSIDQRRNQINVGIYSTYSFGTGAKTVRIIILDVKYNKSSFSVDDPDMLGEKQWKWLENIFKKTKETYTFIVTSNPILSHDRIIAEKWYEKSRKRIFDLIGQYQRSGVVFLSGGIGYSEILKTFCPLPKVGYNLYEITSSGLGYNKKLTSIYSAIYHNDYLIPTQRFIDINFGQIDIYWGDKKDSSDSFILLQIFDKNNKKQLEVKINHEQLLPKDTKEFYISDNLKKISYMNITESESCEREIYHRVKTPFMNVKYYLTNLQEMPVAIASVIFIIIISHYLVHKPIKFIMFSFIVSGLVYLLYNIYDMFSYYDFEDKILKKELP